MAATVLLAAGCRDEEPVGTAGPAAPLAVVKSNPLPVLAHYMPWYETLGHGGDPDSAATLDEVRRLLLRLEPDAARTLLATL